MNVTCELNDAELDEVPGGMTCENAKLESSVYNSLSNWYGSIGMSAASVGYLGLSIGVLRGGCLPN